MNWNQLLTQWHRLLGYFGYEPALIPVESRARTQPGVPQDDDQRGSPFASPKAPVRAR
jgi:hypothetical protein